jgi:hypothetical protein
MGAAEPASERPIFIIGCARSGTTLVRLILDSHPRISAGAETKFLPELGAMVERARIEGKFDVSRAYVLELMRGFYGRLQGDYMIRRGKRRWAEKTPGYTMHLPLIEELYPTAQYVHVIRDGRDVVASHRDRWGYRTALGTGLRKWPAYITVARRFARGLPPDRYHEMRYEDLVREPEQTARELFAFLGEPWDPQVLAYDLSAHSDMDQVAGLQAERRRSGGDGRLIYASRVQHGASLDPLLRMAVWLGGRQLLEELGYTGRSSKRSR